MTPSSVIFISYSHDSDEHRDRVLALSERLRQEGYETRLDRYVNGTPDKGWPRWMLDRLDEAAFVLVICTETYYRRFRGHEEPGQGKGVDWEGALITQEIYDARGGTVKFVPVLFEAADERFIPEPLRGATRYTLNSKENFDSLCQFVDGVAGVQPARVGPRNRRKRQMGKPLEFDDEKHAPRKPPGSDRPWWKRKVLWCGIMAALICLVLGGAFLLRRPTIKVATKGWAGYAPIYIAHEMGLCQGVRFEFVEVRDVEDMMDHLSYTNGKSADVGAWLVDSHVLARKNGVPAVAILKLDISRAADAMLASVEITDFKQLANKKVAYQRTDPAHSLLLVLCQENNMTMQSFEDTIESDPEQAVEMFRKGEVDAAVSYDPWLQQAEEALNAKGQPPAVHRPFDGSHLEKLNHPIVDILVVREDFLATRRKHIKSLLRGCFRAVDLLKDKDDPQHSVAVRHFCDFMTKYAPKLNGMPYDYSDFESLTAPSNMELADWKENKRYFEPPQNEGFSEFREQLYQANRFWHEVDRAMLGSQPFQAKSTPSEAGDGSQVLLDTLDEMGRGY